MSNYNWAVLGCGVIANQMAQALHKMGKKLYGVANRTHSKAVAFAEKYGVEKVYDTIDDLFLDEKVDIIYITTPHNTHYGFMKKALEHGKHIFVEKSITLNSAELDEMIALAKEKNLVIGEAMTIWHMPLYKKLWEIVERGDLGKVQMITMNFGSFKEYNMENRFFNMKLAGGAMLDIGVYALSIVRSFMEEKPDQIVSQWKPAPTGTDEQATILLMNRQQQMATVALSMHSKQPKRAMISCEKGYIEIMEYPRADKAIIVDAATGAVTEVEDGDTEDALYYEMVDMEDAIHTGDSSKLKLEYTKDVMDIMTELRYSWGMKYPEEPLGTGQLPRTRSLWQTKGTQVVAVAPSLTVRRFEEKDAKAVSALVEKTLRTVNKNDYTPEEIDAIMSHMQPADIINRSKWTHFYVFCLGDTIVGTGAIGPYWDSRTESSLFTIFVHADYQGMGIGRRIMETLESDELFLKAERVEIPASITATPFYRKWGYDYKDGITEPDEEKLLRLEKYPGRK